MPCFRHYFHFAIFSHYCHTPPPLFATPIIFIAFDIAFRCRFRFIAADYRCRAPQRCCASGACARVREARGRGKMRRQRYAAACRHTCARVTIDFHFASIFSYFLIFFFTIIAADYFDDIAVYLPLRRCQLFSLLMVFSSFAFSFRY
jgi:hypothetical protein